MDLAISATLSSSNSAGASVGDLAELCRFAEGLGYQHAWLAEVAGPDPFVLATAIAAATKRMELGVAVVPVFTRTPVVLATAAISVSQVLGGRAFHLGMGSSTEVIVGQWHGQAFTRPVRRVTETVQAVRSILDGAEGFQGETVRTSRFRPAITPAGPIDLWVAGLRPQMLVAAAEVADGICLNLMPARVVERQIEAANLGGRSLGVMARLQVMVTDDVPGARAQLRSQMLGPYLAQPVYNRFLAWMGFPEEAAAIASAWAQKDRAGVTAAIPDHLVDDLALLGSPTTIRDRLDEFAAAGVTVAALSVLSSDRQVVSETVRALAP